MVDVGGSQGHACIKVLRRFPSVRCIVEDSPEAIAGAEVPADLNGHLSFQVQNFFTEQSVKGPDLYFSAGSSTTGLTNTQLSF